MSVPDWRQPQGLRGRPGFKPTCRAEFAAWTASGRAGLGSGGRRQGLAGLRDDAPSERSATKRRRCGGHRGACAAWPRCRWAAAGPGLDPRRRTEPHVSDHAPLVWRAPEGPEGQAGLRDDAPSERSATKRRRCGGHRGACAAWPRCRWAAAGPGLDPRRRTEPHVSDHAPLVWRAPEGPEGQGGLRDRPLRAKLACGDLAGGRARRRPENPVVPQAPPESQNSS